MSDSPYVDAADAIHVLQEARPPASLEGLRAAYELVEAADMVLRQEVSVARSHGVTWAAIGSVLGVSRQAAQMRFPTIYGEGND